MPQSSSWPWRAQNTLSKRRAVIQELVRKFLSRSAYVSPNTKKEDELRTWLAAQVARWDVDIAPAFFERTMNASCIFVETVYGHTPPANRRYIALYNVCMFYADDLNEHAPDAILHFSRRFITGARQPNDVLECLAGLLRQAYELWPQYGADSIVTGTLEALAANHVEVTTREMRVKPLATRYPAYLRERAGISAPYTHFLFAGGWRASPESYLQIIPDLDHWALGTNLSFYKEELAGETNNYVHIRAAAEQAFVEDTLARLVEEVSHTADRVKAIVADDVELSEVCTRYMQSYLEFHLKTPRYRLTELGFSA
ncbi:terpenoid synthase [Trametes elegans]|nr:terpenoid synthase [Trametes elegans]